MNKNLPIKVYDSFIKIFLSSLLTICFGVLTLLLAFYIHSFDIFPFMFGISFIALGIVAIIISFRHRKIPMLIIDQEGLSGILIKKGRLSLTRLLRLGKIIVLKSSNK